MTTKKQLGGGLVALLADVQEETESVAANEKPAAPEEPIARDGHTKIITDFSRWQFTERQYSVLMFIQSLSGPKGYTIIDKLKHFTLAGVDTYRASKVLQELHEAKVIDWNRHMNTFRIRYEMVSEWQVPLEVGFDEEVLGELRKINNVSDTAT